MNKNYKNISIILATILILSFVGILLYSQWQNKLSGKIIYRRISKIPDRDPYYDDNYKYQYFLIDFDNNFIDTVGYYLGNPEISNNGNYFAVNCEKDITNLCLVDISNLSSKYIYPRPLLETKIPDIEIELPKECSNLISEKYGIESMAWSPDDESIAILCGNNFREDTQFRENETNKKICVIDIFTGNSFCQEENQVQYIDWSIKTNQLLFSTNENEVFIASIVNGKFEKEYLFDGRFATWSPNGKKIAFVDSNTSKMEIFDITSTRRKILIDNDEYFHFDDSKIAWSPNGAAISFQASLGTNYYTPNVLYLNLRTEEIQCLSCFNNEYKYEFNPTWGK